MRIRGIRYYTSRTIFVIRIGRGVGTSKIYRSHRLELATMKLTMFPRSFVSLARAGIRETGRGTYDTFAMEFNIRGKHSKRGISSKEITTTTIRTTMPVSREVRSNSGTCLPRVLLFQAVPPSPLRTPRGFLSIPGAFGTRCW